MPRNSHTPSKRDISRKKSRSDSRGRSSSIERSRTKKAQISSYRSSSSSHSKKLPKKCKDNYESKYRSKRSPRKHKEILSSRTSSTRSRSSSSESSSSSFKSSKSLVSHTSSKTKVEEGPSFEIIENQINKRVLEQIEENFFVQKAFSSTKKTQDKATERETSLLPIVEGINFQNKTILHSNFVGFEDRKMEKWIKKLFNYRQKYFLS